MSLVESGITVAPANLRLRVATGALVVMQLMNAGGEAVPLPEVIESFEATRLPRSLLPFLALSKVASALALVLPVRRVLREWVFAGILIDVIGAAFAYLLAGRPDAFGLKMVPLALAVWGWAYFEHRAASGPLFDVGEKRYALVARWLLALGVAIAAIGEIRSAEPVLVSLDVLAFPVTILPILAVAKILAVLALTVRRFPTLRTWAQAGLAFNFAGALYSFARVGRFLLPDVPLLLGLSTLLVLAVLGRSVVERPAAASRGSAEGR